MDILSILAAVPGFASYLPYAAAALGVCAIIAAQLPPPKQPQSAYGIVYLIINILGQNYKHARNIAIPAPASQKP